MNAVEILVLNLREVRRRSLIVWGVVPDTYLAWKPDAEAMSLGESIRHTWESAAYYHGCAKAGRSSEVQIVGSDQPITELKQELRWADQTFTALIDYVLTLTESDLNKPIDRSDVGYVRPQGDFLARVAYHEAIHTGQLLQMLRQAGLERPDIWD